MHNILDEDKVVTVGEPAWHKLGPTFDSIGAVDAHNEMGGSFTLYKKPVGVLFDYEDGDDNGYDVEDPDEDPDESENEFVVAEEYNQKEFIRIPKHWAIVRGPTNKDARKLVFDYVTDSYHIVQPDQICQKFDEKVGVSIASMGFIQDGRKMFLSWPLKTIEVIEGDEVQMFGNVMFGFDSIFSSRLTIGTFRVVCENTFNAALAEVNQNDKEGKKGRGTIYSGKHTNKHLLNDLGEWMGFIQQNVEKQTELVTGLFKQFAATPIVHEKQAQDLIYTAWPNPSPVPDQYPEALREKKQKTVDAETEKMTGIRNGVYDLYSTTDGINITEDYWGLFNSATQYFNHEQKSKKDTAYSISWGNRYGEMNKFAEVLRADINKAK